MCFTLSIHHESTAKCIILTWIRRIQVSSKHISDRPCWEFPSFALHIRTVLSPQKMANIAKALALRRDWASLSSCFLRKNTRKIHIEPENDDLEDDFLFQECILRLHLNLPRCDDSDQLCHTIDVRLQHPHSDELFDSL